LANPFRVARVFVSNPGFSLTLEPRAEISERLRRIPPDSTKQYQKTVPLCFHFG